MSYLNHLECTKCSATFEQEKPITVCSKCGGSLLARYDLQAAKGKVTKASFANAMPGMWRYHELLPVNNLEGIATMYEGMTPMMPTVRLGKQLGIPNLLFKNEGMNPTGSFKDRGASVGVSKLKEIGVTDIVMSSSGNAGVAWAAYCARGGLNAHIVLAADSSDCVKAQCWSFGGDIRLNPGGHVANITGELAKANGWFESNTMRDPWRPEGKKTMGFEIAEQLGWKIPDVIVFPTGGGLGIVAMWKAFQELAELGIVEKKQPRFVSVQYEGCAPLVKAFNEGKEVSEPWTDKIDIVPGGMRTAKPYADYLVLRILRETGGQAIAVSKEETYKTWQLISETEALFAGPETATTIAAAQKLRESGFIRESDSVVSIVTATGIKYVPLIHPEFPSV